MFCSNLTSDSIPSPNPSHPNPNNTKALYGIDTVLIKTYALGLYIDPDASRFLEDYANLPPDEVGNLSKREKRRGGGSSSSSSSSSVLLDHLFLLLSSPRSPLPSTKLHMICSLTSCSRITLL